MTTLELINVTLTTGDVRRVLGVSLCVTPGRVIAIVGANGSGKSSLLRVMAGHMTPTSGRVLLDERPISEWSPIQRSRHLAWLGQSTRGADSFAVRDVVAWGLTSREKGQPFTGPEPEAALADLELSHLAAAPLGSLSGGERQRAHLARILVQASPVTLLDEPDASLDDVGRRLLRSAITEKKRIDHSIVVVTHDHLWAQDFADEIWVVNAGRLSRQ